jgi:hypothetical protein
VSHEFDGGDIEPILTIKPQDQVFDLVNQTASAMKVYTKLCRSPTALGGLMLNWIPWKGISRPQGL